MVVIRCGSVADVVAGLEYARETGIHAVARGGGHCFAGRSSIGGIVLDMADLDGISLAGNGYATIGAGARLAQVYEALHVHGRTIPAGCGATVGIAGLTLGGGMGLLGRKHGLTCDRLVGARVVLADGRIVDCDEYREPELFWALRGAGGGQFGVVTSLIFDTVPEPITTRFELRWPQPVLGEIVAAWQDWAPGAPDEITANLTIVAEPGQPPQAVLFGASLTDEAATRDLLHRFGGAAEVRGGLAYHQLKNTFAELDSREEPEADIRIRSEFFAQPMRPATIDTLLSMLTTTFAGGDVTGRRQLTFTAMGGAYNRVPGNATAFAHRRELFVLEHIAAAASTWIDRSWQIAHAEGSGGVYPNFPDPRLDDWATAYHGGNHSRLAAAKRAYDPDRLFHFPQSL